MFRRRFADVIARQLDVFAEDEADDCSTKCAQTKARTTTAPIATRPRRRTATTSTSSRPRPRRSPTCATASGARSTSDAAEEYDEAFDRAVKKRWPHFGLEIDLR